MLGELRRFAAGLAKPVKAMPKGSADPEAQPQYVKVRERERERERESSFSFPFPSMRYHLATDRSVRLVLMRVG